MALNRLFYPLFVYYKDGWVRDWYRRSASAALDQRIMRDQQLEAV